MLNSRELPTNSLPIRMSVFKLKRLLNETHAFDNTLKHNKDDFKNNNKIYARINNSVTYLSIADNGVEKGSICISGIMRTKLQLSMTDTIVIHMQKPETNLLNEISIRVSIHNKTKNIISIHEDELKEKIKHAFENYYFSNNQALLFNIVDKNYILHIITHKEGYITKDTNITIFSDDVTLNLVGSKLLKRDLFRDNYNFEEIGIGGLNKELIGCFRRALSTRAFKPIIAEKLGIKHVKGILLFGPPGTGKTLIARKIGSMITEREPKIVNGPEIIDKFIGQSEKNIRELFADAKLDYNLNGDNADLHVIIFDEIDAICKTRGRSGAQSGVNDSVVNQLLSMIDGVDKLNNIFIIAMTNRKDLLDEALLRAGRIEVHIEVGLPDLEGRKQIFRIHTNNMQTNSMMGKDVDINELAYLTDNYSGAEIESVVINSGARALYEQLSSTKKEIKDTDIIVNMTHFLYAVEEVSPAFGNINKTIKSLLPDTYADLSEMHKNCYNKANEFIKKNRKLKTILICGKSGTGKTALSAKIAFDNKVKYTKIIRAIDMVSSDEYSKAYYISDAITNSYVSEESLIILDDIEIAINYAKLGHNVTFSNKLYQTLITLLKTEPTIRSHKLTLIVTCSDPEFFNVISNHFDMTFNIDKIRYDNIGNVITTLGYDLENMQFDDDMTIRELLNSI